MTAEYPAPPPDQSGAVQKDQTGASTDVSYEIDSATLAAMVQETQEERRFDLRETKENTLRYLGGGQSLHDLFGPQISDAEAVKAAKEREMEALKRVLGKNAKFLAMPLIRVRGIIPPIPQPGSDNVLTTSPYTNHLRLGTRVPGVFYHFWASPADAHDESTFGNSTQVLLTQHISNKKGAR